MRLPGLILLAGVAAGAAAQTPITPDEFLDRAEGRTLDFHMLGSGALVGTEQFLNRRITVWKRPDRPCVYGTVAVEGAQLCFTYDNDPNPGPVCWWPFADGDRLMVRIARIDDAQIQEVRRISDQPIECPNKPTS